MGLVYEGYWCTNERSSLCLLFQPACKMSSIQQGLRGSKDCGMFHNLSSQSRFDLGHTISLLWVAFLYVYSGDKQFFPLLSLCCHLSTKGGDSRFKYYTNMGYRQAFILFSSTHLKQYLLFKVGLHMNYTTLASTDSWGQCWMILYCLLLLEKLFVIIHRPQKVKSNIHQICPSSE